MRPWASLCSSGATTWLYIAERTSKSLSGAAEATGHYIEGDLTLAANAQREAAKEPKVELPGVDSPTEGQ
ncbi:DUF6507 family protein [Streptomyces sp. NPDC057474]|uniref:DUF6507 family protein n=1 Tax=Streptomyces sp. NPDC057474 TaxID=3346144 RepID=UPI0036D19977